MVGETEFVRQEKICRKQWFKKNWNQNLLFTGKITV